MYILVAHALWRNRGGKGQHTVHTRNTHTHTDNFQTSSSGAMARNRRALLTHKHVYTSPTYTPPWRRSGGCSAASRIDKCALRLCALDLQDVGQQFNNVRASMWQRCELLEQRVEWCLYMLYNMYISPMCSICDCQLTCSRTVTIRMMMNLIYSHRKIYTLYSHLLAVLTMTGCEVTVAWN